MMFEPENKSEDKLDDGPLRHFAYVAGHVFGFLYIVVTLLFGPVKSVANWLAQQALIQRYKEFVGGLAPAAGLALSLLSLGFLELSKIAVLLVYERTGFIAAACTTLLAKLSFGYFAHMTWHAARPKVIEAYPRIRQLDSWVGAQIAIIRGFADRLRARLRALPGYAFAARSASATLQTGVRLIRWLRAIAVKRAGKKPQD